MPDETITYPRRRVARGALRGLGRIILPLLTHTQVEGQERFPDRGPLLVVGNHIAAMEVVLMVVYAPWQMEMLGPGDIPPPPAMDAIARAHGYIPINRGNVDRRALTQSLDVLRRGGVLGMFPEGGIWETGDKPAKRGVAWLSYHARAPILPIGFGGLEGAMNAIFKLKRPPLAMHVGEVIPPVTIPPGTPRKQALQAASARVMQAVRDLIPEAYRHQHPEIAEERFELRVAVRDAQGHAVAVPPDRAISHAQALCKIFYRPAILNIFALDLHIDVAGLQRLVDQPEPGAVAASIDRIMAYLAERNPAFFTYRFGIEEGLAMEAALRELRALVQWVRDMDGTLDVRMVRRYRVAGRDEEVVETGPGRAHTW
jgi:1-acyl-sn-glycerol-3-phosphate acyltransferase